MEGASASPRLPTRCPACKGGLIQRMPRSGRTFIWFHCLFCNHVWKFHMDEADADPNGELTVGISVVNRRGTKCRLGAVGVNAIPEDVLKKHLRNKTLEGELKSRELQRNIDSLTATLEVTQAEEERLWKIQKRDEANRQKARAWSAAYNKIKNIAKQIEDLQAQRQHLTSGAYFFEGLPSSISIATADVEGKLTLVIPRQGRYGIVARASLEQGKDNETYFWIVWVSLSGQHSKRLTLNNGNMLGAGSPDSALQ